MSTPLPSPQDPPPPVCQQPGCGCSIDRRTFLGRVGTGAAALAAAPAWPVVAGPFTPEDVPDHHVPADKKLSPDWVRALTARGERTWYAGEALANIGMPIGGVCAGQVYLTGDGRLAYWDVFNRNQNTGYGAVNYKEGRRPTDTVVGPDQFRPALDLDQGFAVRVDDGQTSWIRRLDQSGFPQVSFCGEYPIGTVEYRDRQAPVAVTLVAFSPFVPLDSAASTFPAVILEYALRNPTDRPVRCTLAGWLENRVCPDHAPRLQTTARRENLCLVSPEASGVVGTVIPHTDASRQPERPPILFAGFEPGDYGGWTASGEAFGQGPASGTLPRQQAVSGFQGRGLVNTYLGGDDRLQGRLVSPAFTVERPWISFLIGGGGHAGRTCLNLMINGKVVRTAAGRNDERLRVENWDVAEFRGQGAQLEIVDAESGGWGHINVDHIEFRDEPAGPELVDLKNLADYGSLGLAYLGEGSVQLAPDLVEPPGREEWFAALRSSSDRQALVPMDRTLRGGVGVEVELAPGESRTLRFAVTWVLPNLYRGDRWVGNAYANRFANAFSVAQQLGIEAEVLSSQTRLWHDTYYDSTLPHWLLDRLHSTVSILATATCQWWSSGRFWGWEGCGCCHGTCGHVWNYEHALARLFPDLERSVRTMQDFAPGIGFQDATGAIGFRGEGWDLWAGDAQAGYILKAYREHLCSADSAFLEATWPRIRQAMQFLLEQDGNADGLIEGRQHQTYDQDYYGANTFVGSLYLAALLAATAMAREMNETEFAARCQEVFESGRRLSMERLFNGDYFIQEVDLSQHPEWQYADGCLADQLFGQTWAHQLGLGYLYPRPAVLQALDAIWKYCWTPDVARQNEVHPPERWFAYPGEAGLFICTWPKTPHLGARSTRYRDEVWTGIEYQVASHLAAEGKVTEALAVCRAVHERYHPAKRNPWNEIECGDHYARALASWGVLIALSGFTYHGPAGRLGFAPRLHPEDFRCAFTAAEGWGTLAQTRKDQSQVCEVQLAWGQLALREVTVEVPEGATVRATHLTVSGRSPATATRQTGREVQLALEEPLTLLVGQPLRLELDLGT